MLMIAATLTFTAALALAVWVIGSTFYQYQKQALAILKQGFEQMEMDGVEAIAAKDTAAPQKSFTARPIAQPSFNRRYAKNRMQLRAPLLKAA